MTQSTSFRISFQFGLILISPTYTYSILVFGKNELSDLIVPQTILSNCDKYFASDCPINPDDPVIKIFFLKR